jgi:hypothetical protein
MALHVVASYQIITEFKRSSYFRVNLGLVATVEKNGKRTFNPNDKFTYFYFNQYKATIYGQGNVGDIKFYVDHFIKDDTFAVYYGDTFEEFLYTFDKVMVIKNNIDFYLGHILKNIEEQYEERVKNEETKKLEVKPEGIAENIVQNPGNVTYADLKAYLDLKQKERYKNNSSL